MPQPGASVRLGAILFIVFWFFAATAQVAPPASRAEVQMRGGPALSLGPTAFGLHRPAPSLTSPLFQTRAQGGQFPIGLPDLLPSIFRTAPVYDSGGVDATSLVIADINGDGKLDLLLTNACADSSCTNGSVTILLGNGDGTYQPAVSYSSAGQTAQFAAVADINNDGNLDLLVANLCDAGSTNCASGSIAVLLGKGDGTFQPAVTYLSGGAQAYGVAIADLNADGKPDLIVDNVCVDPSCVSGGLVTILLGNGDGTFQAAVGYGSGGPTPVFVAVGDLNGDGKPDIVLADQCSNNVNFSGCDNGVTAVLLGNGDGTFQTAVPYSSGGQYANFVAIGDVNGDGVPDLVVANQCEVTNFCTTLGGGIGVLLGRGDGTFQPAVASSSGGNYAFSLAMGDLNGDGKLDLVVANICVDSNCLTAGVDIFIANGDGTFQSPTAYSLSGSHASSVVVADINGDGKTDVLVANNCRDRSCVDGGVSVLLGTGNGPLQATPFYASAGLYPSAVAVADVNGDGNPDLLVANECTDSACTSDNVSVLLGNADGTFKPQVSYPAGGSYAFSVSAADLNGDGVSDLVVSNDCADPSCAAGSVSVLLGNRDGTFNSAVSYGSGGVNADFATVGDVNGDGKPDLLVSNRCSNSGCVNGSVAVLLGNGDGTFQAAVAYGLPAYGSNSLAVADINGDGKLDLVLPTQCGVADCSMAAVHVLLGNGDGSFQTPVSYGSGGTYASSVAIADLNGDGHLDLIVSNQCADSACVTGNVSIGVLLGNGDGTFQTAVATAIPGSNIAQLAVADFNGDGKLDVASGYTNFLLLGNGDGTFQPPSTLGAAGSGIAVGDFNHDGKPDLAIGGVSILFNVAPNFHYATSATISSSPNPSNYSQPITFTAAVSGTNTLVPTGTVTFNDGGKPIGSATLNNGTASISLSNLSVSAHSINAAYGGDSNFLATTSPSTSQIVNTAPTSTTLASSLNPAIINQSVTYTAAVSSPYGLPLSGTFTFKDGAKTLATVPISTATYTTSYSTANTHSISVAYSGDANDAASSALLTETINRIPTSTTISVDINPSTFGQTITYTGTTTSSIGPPPNTETLTFKEQIAGVETVLGTGALHNGVATFSISTLAVGTHSIKVSYLGDGKMANSHSNYISQVVNPVPTSTSVTSSLNPSVYGQGVTFTATVVSSGAATPTGSVTFKNGSSTLGIATLSAGVASFTTTKLSAGVRNITAFYSGDTQSAKSSGSFVQTVSQASSNSTVNSSVNPSRVGQVVKFVATVTSSTTTPVGTVTFMDGGTALGIGTLSGGKANYSTSSLASGSHNITTVYSGTVNITGSTSPLLVQTVH